MTEPCISLNNISFAYDKCKIYEGFSLNIDYGDLLFIMGVNGCGKTTLLKLIGSFLQVQQGSILIQGKDIGVYDSKALARTMAYVPQMVHLNSDFLVKDYLALGRTPYKAFCASPNRDDYQIVEKYAAEQSITHLLDSEFNTLSGGQKQNAAICRALIQETPIIIMDEPMSALDIGKQAEFISLIRRLQASGKTIVLTSHNPNHALCLDCKVCLIHDGNILGEGSASEVLTPHNIARIYGTKVKIVENDGQKNLVFNIFS